MDCEQALERMSEALDGPLSLQAREELDDHLARCPHCAALFEALKGQSQVLRELDPPRDCTRRFWTICLRSGPPERQARFSTSAGGLPWPHVPCWRWLWA